MIVLPTPARPLRAGEPGFVAAHRALGEFAAGRPVLIRHGGNTALTSPLEGGRVLSGGLALTAVRAAHLGLGDYPVFVRDEVDRERLMALATGERTRPAEAHRAGPIAHAATELAKLAERLPAATLGEPREAPAGTLSAEAADILAFRAALATTLEPVATANVPLAAGAPSVVTAFRDAAGGIVSTVAVGAPSAGSLVRVHSSCVTGDIFGSLKCDCGAQLALALSRIAADGGILVYASQEGRGIGLANKLRAYNLQDGGMDTVDANLALGFHDDERDYAAAAKVLRTLGLRSVRLLTNNPNKAAGLEAHGLTVTPVPLVGPVTAENAHYLATKRERSGHLL